MATMGLHAETNTAECVDCVHHCAALAHTLNLDTAIFRLYWLPCQLHYPDMHTIGLVWHAVVWALQGTGSPLEEGCQKP